MYSQLVTRRVRRIVLTAAVLPLVVLIGLRSAWAAYACSVDGEVRSACCCPKKADTERAAGDDEVPRIEANCCCDVTVGESSAAPDAREVNRSNTDDFSCVVVVATPVVAPVARATVRSTPVALARPPPRSVPTYLANRTILR